MDACDIVMDELRDALIVDESSDRKNAGFISRFIGGWNDGWIE